MGTSLPVVFLYCPRMKSLICSSLACSTADYNTYQPMHHINHRKMTTYLVRLITASHELLLDKVDT
jgi:hypothetical protein